MSRIYLSPPDVRKEDFAALDAVLDSNWVAPVGPCLKAFEDAISTRVGRAHAVALHSGTAALHLALKLLKVQPGDEVICPAFSFIASANPIRYCGAEPVFVDSEPATWNMDPNLLHEELKERAAHNRLPKVIIVVHLYGQCADMDPIEEICRYYEIPIVEDAAEALGACYKGRPAGSMGALSFFSFNGNKIITTSGGGMLLADNKTWIERAHFLATQAREPTVHYEHVEIGYNYRMSNLLAGLGISQFADLDRRIAARRMHFEFYQEALSDLPGVSFMPLVDPDTVNYWLTCLTVDPEAGGVSHEEIIQALEQADIESRPLWKPLHLQPVFKQCKFIGSGCAEALFTRGLCLPSGSSLRAEERARVIDVIRACFS